jgi:hypothetical protein
MRIVYARCSCAWLILSTAACGGHETGAPSGTGGNSGLCNEGTIIANEANDYSFWSHISFPPVKVKPESDLTFDWSGVTADIQRHAVDPKNLTLIAVAGFEAPLADLEKAMNSDSSPSRYLMGIPAQYSPAGGKTSANILNFTTNGSPVDSQTILGYLDADFYPPDKTTYLVMVSSSQEVGTDVLMSQSFLTDPSSSNTTVSMTKDSTTLDFKADLTRLTPTMIPAGRAALTLDWGKMKTNALGNTFILSKITSAMLAHYKETPEELSGDKFLDLELIATELYRADIPADTLVNFADMRDSKSNSFKGIDETGTWIVALKCDGCRNPAPWYIAVLKPCS